ncbi:TonB-dependent receptor [Sphingomonas sp. BN140010]|uniref:TonB-dependent receptor n=1 Tax=Sphingomonas arvum TaxID=2992113 RepID=A0ABT3JDB2_9SPHN|nr:TonB-dependent receptor [Sphingomonas sp. BN140010]MCW3797052.1 TonB-dependent receptor [Sphingomonas sp. BN140010]
MGKHVLLSATALRSALFIGAVAGLAVPAAAQQTPANPTEAPDTAQDVPPPKPDGNEPAGTVVSNSDGTTAVTTADPAAAPTPAAAQDVVVTGSRIRRPNLESTVPITSIGGEEFFETGNVSVGDTLNDLPALRSTLGQSNSTQFLGTAGLNLLDLRGLGTQRTLVLVNGRRHVPGDILNNANSPDTNTIPTDLIERVDTVTGGNSAIYGSDAIAGVVNFILKQDYEGVQVRGQSGVSKYGDAGSYYASILAGQNFADGRGNVAVNVEFARQNDYYASGRPNLRTVSGFVTVDTDDAACDAQGLPAGCAVNGSDGNPDAVFFRDIRNGFYTNAGTFLNYEGGDQYTNYIFQPDGTLARQTGTQVGLPFSASFIGGNGDNFNDGTQTGLSPALNRYSFNLIGHYDISDAFKPFVEAKFSRTKSLGNASGPFFTGATTGEQFSSRNPYLTDQARDIIGSYYYIYGDYYDAQGNPGANGVLDAREQDFGFLFYKNAVELGNREEKGTRDTYRVVAGVRGDLGSNLNYEISANYGQHRERTQINGNVNLQRYLLAIDAVRNPANNQIVCRAQIDPTAGQIYADAVDVSFAQAQLASDIANCVPINLFGNGNITAAARDYLLTNSKAKSRLTQFDLTGFLAGNTESFFNFQGGPIGFAVGGEYRRETAYYDQDEFTQSGLSFYNAIPKWDSPAFVVKEAFAELRFPFFKNKPFLDELTLSVAGRASDYRGRTGTVYAYNAGLDWAPIKDIRFRGNYSRAVRAPNLSDLSFPLSQNFSLVDDPCAARFRNLNSNRAANCAAAGVPTAFDYVYRSSLGFQSGGNPNLREETSDSFTVGGVLQPRFMRGFSLSVDYYDITVNNVITSLSAQSILNACYDQTSIDNQFCGQFQRYTGTGTGPNGEIPGRIIENSLQVVPLNFAKLKVRGIDVEAAYRRDFGALGRFNGRFIYTRALENSSFLNPIDPDFGNTLNGELGNPKNAFNLKLSLQRKAITLGYEMRFLDRMTIGSYENYFSYQGRPPQNEDAFERRYYPRTFYHDARLAIDATKQFNFYLGVDNIFNTNPPLGLSGIGDGSAIYTNRGRFFYAGAVAKF